MVKDIDGLSTKIFYEVEEQQIKMSSLKLITLENLRLQLSAGQFYSAPRKLLKLSATNFCLRTKTPCLLLSPTIIQWKEKLTISVEGARILDFEIANVHWFGYDPREFEEVLKGTIDLDGHSDKVYSWGVLDIVGRSVGILTALVSGQSNIPTRNMSGPIQEIKEEPKILPVLAPNADQEKEFKSLSIVQKPKSSGNTPKHFITIHSIVVSTDLNAPQIEAIFIEVQTATKKVRTTSFEGSKKQIAWIDTLKFTMQQDQNEIQFNFYGCYGTQKQILYQGKTSIQKFGAKKRIASHRVQLTDKSGAAGILFADIECTSQQDYNKGPKKQNRFTLPPPKTTEYCRRENDHKTPLTSSQTLKNSILSPNRSIVFPKEKRFVDYKDRPSPIVSYLQNDSIFDSNAKKKYLGPSMGYGQKYDFTKQCRQNPGVGHYTLPSIWDRY